MLPIHINNKSTTTTPKPSSSSPSSSASIFTSRSQLKKPLSSTLRNKRLTTICVFLSLVIIYQRFSYLQSLKNLKDSYQSYLSYQQNQNYDLSRTSTSEKGQAFDGNDYLEKSDGIDGYGQSNDKFLSSLSGLKRPSSSSSSSDEIYKSKDSNDNERFSKTTEEKKKASIDKPQDFSLRDDDDDENGWESPTKPMLESDLKDRLKSWRDSPLTEPSRWVQFNLKTCNDDRVGKNSEVWMLNKAHLTWATMNSSHIREKREELINSLEIAEKEGKLSSKNFGKGRGIVFAAGNVDTFQRVLLTVRMLREHLRCELPVEIFSFPGERPDKSTKENLETLNVKFRVIGWAKKDIRRTKNFHIKASSLLESSFREPLYLDSDNMPAVLEPGSIESLWESKGYKKLGAMFWPDYWKTAADVPIWLLIGTQCRDEWAQEAGQILIDKSKHLDVLLLSELMLKDWKYWFNFSDGDKDIFRFSMLALRKRWALPGRFLGAAGLSWNTETGFCGHTMLQHDHIGRPMFVHMNLLKMIPSGITRGTTFKRTRTLEVPMIKEEFNEDYGVEADMLANSDDHGKSIIEAPEPVKRRAILERGLIPFFHGGDRSARCIDIRWEDPRRNLKEEDNSNKKMMMKDLKFKDYKEEEEDNLIKDPTKIVEWNDDLRLKDFEERFFSMGGVTNAVGF